MRRNQTIQNRRTGETLTMLVGEDENNGTLQLYRVQLPPHRPSPPLHYHRAFTETFTVQEGTLKMYLGREGRRMILQPGDSLTAQVGQPHTFANHANEPCVMTVETRPAGGVVKAFQIAYGVANDGGAAEDGLPKNPVVRLRFVEISQGFLSGIPVWLHKMAFLIATILARLTGIEHKLKKYQ
jgi:quercetin dioxygenase-like cupin family protein